MTTVERVSLGELVASILGEPTRGFWLPVTCPVCDGGFEVDHIGEPSSRHTDAEVTCGGCGREYVVSVALRPKPR